MDFVTDHAILSLDGKVFEAFVGRGTIQWRMHVEYLGIEVKPKRNGELKIVFGHKVGNDIAPAVNVEIDAARMPEMEAFCATLTAARDSAA
jgi:hypothetical protein